MLEKIQITQSKLLLVEGQDEVSFFDVLLKHLDLRDVQVIEVGGRDKFRLEFPNIRNLTNNFETLTSYAVIRDADVDKAAAFQSVKGVLAANGQTAPNSVDTWDLNTSPKVGVYILPGEDEPGMLEDLCLQTVTGTPVMPCVVSFMECLREKLEDAPPNQERHPGEEYFYPRNPHKAKAKAFLASLYGDIPSVGIAARKGIWRLDHAALRPLVDFLRAFG